MTSGVQAVCALTRDRRVKSKHLFSAQCRSQKREAGASACRENADDTRLSYDPEGDTRVTDLLQFVNLISSDIKTALSRSPRSKRNVDHKKYLERQLLRLTSVPAGSFVLRNIESPHNKCDSLLTQCETDSDYEMLDEVTTYKDIKELKSKGVENTWQETKMLNDTGAIQGTEVCKQDVFMGTSRIGEGTVSEKCTEHSLNKNQKFCLPELTQNHFQKQSSHLKRMYSSTTCYGAATLCSSDSFQKQEVPLRQRQLPASFWQEPNVPRFQFENPYFHGLYFNLHEQTQSYKAFLERLQTAQRYRFDNVGSSQFPITDFLYHKYGIKDSVNSYPPNDFLTPSYRLPADFKTVSGFSAPSGTPAVHPYAETLVLPNRNWDFFLGKLPSAYDALHPAVWKPVATKTSHLNRYHPFRE